MGGRGGPSRQKGEGSQAPAATAASPAQIMENAIFSAYQDLRKDPYFWVALDSLRERLPGTKAEQDEALKKLVLRENGGIRLIPEENQKTITDSDRRAAIRLSGEDKHLIGIAERDRR